MKSDTRHTTVIPRSVVTSRSMAGIIAVREALAFSAQSSSSRSHQVSRAREILISGRLSRIGGFREPLVTALSRLGPVRCLDAGTKVKEAAWGAALIADGLAGGRYRELVEVMRLREARGTVLDELYLTGAEEVRGWALGPARC